jgi:hypothetical protein
MDCITIHAALAIGQQFGDFFDTDARDAIQVAYNSPIRTG